MYRNWSTFLTQSETELLASISALKLGQLASISALKLGQLLCFIVENCFPHCDYINRFHSFHCSNAIFSIILKIKATVY